MGRRIKNRIFLRTMGQEKTVNSSIVTGFEVCSLEGKELIEIPELYTQGEILVMKEHIPTQESVKKYRFSNLKSHIDIELLIGIIAPTFMELWKLINRC
jgi:hypothetical protein